MAQLEELLGSWCGLVLKVVVGFLLLESFVFLFLVAVSVDSLPSWPWEYTASAGYTLPFALTLLL